MLKAVRVTAIFSRFQHETVILIENAILLLDIESHHSMYCRSTNYGLVHLALIGRKRSPVIEEWCFQDTLRCPRPPRPPKNVCVLCLVILNQLPLV